MIIRNAQFHDLDQIVNIYNWAIENTTATFDTQTKSVDSQRTWFDEHDEGFPLFVIDIENQVIGWGSISRWSDRCAYSSTGEDSFYIHPDHHGKGYGSLILKHLVERGREIGFRTLLSRVTEESESSLHLHRKYGFNDIGVMKKVGEKHGKVLDVVLLQYIY